MRVPMGRSISQAGHDLHPTVFHAPHRQDALGDRLELIGLAAHDHDLETEVMRQVDMQRRPHAFAQLMLQLGQLLAEVANVMIIDERQRADGVDPLGDLGPSHLAAREVAQQFGAGAATLLHQCVELPEQ
jgi:hypothetical protein